jgi:hypothetical protein
MTKPADPHADSATSTGNGEGAMPQLRPRDFGDFRRCHVGLTHRAAFQ